MPLCQSDGLGEIKQVEAESFLKMWVPNAGFVLAHTCSSMDFVRRVEIVSHPCINLYVVLKSALSLRP